VGSSVAPGHPSVEDDAITPNPSFILDHGEPILENKASNQTQAQKLFWGFLTIVPSFSEASPVGMPMPIILF
jgi:hypothetical protein